jgi:hypothetical protein
LVIYNSKILQTFAPIISNKINKLKIIAVQKSITLSGATTIPAGSNISLRATDFIELKAGFEVPTGRELYLDVTPCLLTIIPNNW